MAADLIRCPGCGVNMDLSVFPVRPEQVVCPRCHMRSIVPPLYYAPYGIQNTSMAPGYSRVPTADFQEFAVNQQDEAPISSEHAAQFYHDDLLSASQLFASQPQRSATEETLNLRDENIYSSQQSYDHATYPAYDYEQQFQSQAQLQVDPRYYQGYQQMPSQYLQGAAAQYGQAYYVQPQVQYNPYLYQAQPNASYPGDMHQVDSYAEVSHQPELDSTTGDQQDLSQYDQSQFDQNQNDLIQHDQDYYGEPAYAAEAEQSIYEEDQNADKLARSADEQIDFVGIQDENEALSQDASEFGYPESDSFGDGIEETVEESTDEFSDDSITGASNDEAQQESGDAKSYDADHEDVQDSASEDTQCIEDEETPSSLLDADTQEETVEIAEIADTDRNLVEDREEVSGEDNTILDDARKGDLEDNSDEIAEDDFAATIEDSSPLEDSSEEIAIIAKEIAESDDPLSSELSEKEPTTGALPIQQQEDKGLLLPIDKKGNVEPLAFALIGFLSTIFLMPFIGIVLCIISLAMSSKEKKCNLYNAYRKPSRVFAVLGLILNIIILVLEIAIMTSIFVAPSFLMALLY